MTKIKYEDEPDLQRKIRDLLNRQGFHFKKVPHDFDLIDNINQIYVEVKLEDFAPAQILYAIIKENKQDSVKFIGLACSSVIMFYKMPPINFVLEFIKRIDPMLSKAPSEVYGKELNEEAFKILGKHWYIYTYDGKIDLEKSITEIFVNGDNLENFIEIFKKYEIDSPRFLSFIADIYSKNESIMINKRGWIYNPESEKFFENKDVDEKNKGVDNKYHGDHGYNSIKNYRDRRLFGKICINSDDITKINQQIIRLESIAERRSKGCYFTGDDVSNEISNIIKEIKPDFIIEPYVGAGSLIEPLKEQDILEEQRYSVVANDIDEDSIETLKKKYGKLNWKFTNVNTITTSTKDLIELWKIPKNKDVMILTNPPFGRSAVGRLGSKKGEIKDGKIVRKIKIDYADLGDKYGRGNIVFPAIGRLIEIIKKLGDGYLAIFSPMAIFCGRNQSKKILIALLNDFEFIEGYIYSGDKFDGVSPKIPIAFTIWRYKRGINTNIESLSFTYNSKLIRLKRLSLLKDGWIHINSKYEENEEVLRVASCEVFNWNYPQMFSVTMKKIDGVQPIEKNVKIDLRIPNIPSELAYALWSTCVGTNSISDYPIYIGQAYTHLPDFFNDKTKEIIAYAVIYNLISELYKNYCEGEIGFDRMSGTFRFGNEQVTKGTKYLIKTYGNCKIGENKTILEVFNELKDEPDIKKINKKYRSLIKKEIEDRLDSIGYWDYIPISKHLFK